MSSTLLIRDAKQSVTENTQLSPETRMFLVQQAKQSINSLKQVLLLLDENYSDALSHNQLYKKIAENKEDFLITCCTSVFSSSTLDKGYDVTALRADGSYIIMSELFEANQTYTQRNMRKGHHLERLLLSGEFTFKEI